MILVQYRFFFFFLFFHKNRSNRYCIFSHSSVRIIQSLPCGLAGLLTLISPLDFEVSREYYLSVEGSRGKSSLSDITTIIINVTDVNDNTPAFGRGDYSAEISEDLTPGSLVMKVRAKTHICSYTGRRIFVYKQKYSICREMKRCFWPKYSRLEGSNVRYKWL